MPSAGGRHTCARTELIPRRLAALSADSRASQDGCNQPDHSRGAGEVGLVWPAAEDLRAVKRPAIREPHRLKSTMAGRLIQGSRGLAAPRLRTDPTKPRLAAASECGAGDHVALVSDDLAHLLDRALCSLGRLSAIE